MPSRSLVRLRPGGPPRGLRALVLRRGLDGRSGRRPPPGLRRRLPCRLRRRRRSGRRPRPPGAGERPAGPAPGSPAGASAHRGVRRLPQAPRSAARGRVDRGADHRGAPDQNPWSTIRHPPGRRVACPKGQPRRSGTVRSRTPAMAVRSWLRKLGLRLVVGTRQGRRTQMPRVATSGVASHRIRTTSSRTPLLGPLALRPPSNWRSLSSMMRSSPACSAYLLRNSDIASNAGPGGNLVRDRRRRVGWWVTSFRAGRWPVIAALGR